MLNERTSQRGAATVEFYLVGLLALLPMCLGMLQGCLLMVANHHVDHAAFMAVRSGATHGADSAAMRTEFARVLSPQFVAASGGIDAGNAVARVSLARSRALADVTLYAHLRTLSPNADARRDHGIVRDNALVIPGDSLQHRNATPGPQSGLSLQQANMLRVEFTYCQPLVVPLVRTLLTGLLKQLDGDPWHQRCYRAGRLPIRSVGTAPMQSDFRSSAAP